MTTMPRLKHALNRQLFPVQGEVNKEPSMTIPDDTLSIKQILDRYAHGLSVGGKIPIYEGEDEETPDIRRMDLSEIHDLKTSTRDRVLEIQKDLQSQEQKKARKKLIDEVEQDYLKKNPKKTVPPLGGAEGGDQDITKKS